MPWVGARRILGSSPYLQLTTGRSAALAAALREAALTGLVFDPTRNIYYLNGIGYSDITAIPGWSYSRSGSAYDLAATTLFGANVPRRTAAGLLVEAAATNLFTQSSFGSVTGSAGSEFPNGTGWSNFFQTGGTRTFIASSVLAGTQALNVSGVSGARNVIGFSFSPTASTTYTVSFWIESVSNVTGIVSYAEGALGSGGTSNNITAPTAPGRVSYTFTTGTGPGTVNVRFGVGASGGDSGSISISNVQLELGSVASSYIPTTTAAASRGADVATSAVSFSGAHTLLVATGENSGASSYFFHLRGTSGNETLLWRPSTVNAYMESGGSTEANQSVGALITAGQTVAARFSTNDVRGASNGTLGAADTSATLPVGALTVASFGSSGSGSQMNGNLRLTAILPRALTDAELQAVTA